MAYILIDAIGIKQLFQTNKQEAINKCQHFWNSIKVKALNDDIGSRYVTFSDSALVFIPQKDVPTGVKLVIWIRNLLDGLKKATGTEFYAIANTGSEADPNILHDILPVEINQNCEQRYVHIAGLGDDFANLFYAEDEIQKQRQAGCIPQTARIYVNESLLESTQINIHPPITFKGLGGQSHTLVCMD